ncbi:hypothetical protein PMAYCL1PPCAC_05187, partial [Pristionchus mayeri]
MNVLLDEVCLKLHVQCGAKKLYTTDGKEVKHIDDLENGKDYVAASTVFIPFSYADIPTVKRWERPNSSVMLTPTDTTVRAEYRKF